jgi:hypothetical protein
MTKFFGGARLCLQDQPRRLEALRANGFARVPRVILRTEHYRVEFTISGIWKERDKWDTRALRLVEPTARRERVPTELTRFARGNRLPPWETVSCTPHYRGIHIDLGAEAWNETS